MEAEAWHRSNDILFITGVADGSTRFQERLAENGIGHAGLPPDGSNQFIAPDRPITMLKQIRDAIEDSR